MAPGGTRPSDSAPSVVEPASERTFTIGEVVAQLQADFPGLSISKIRYLEDRRLLAPARSKGRYRRYTRADVRVLRTVLALQRDEYLPLEVIRERMDKAVPVAGRSSVAAGGTAITPRGIKREEPVYSLKELCEAAGVGEAFVTQLEEFHLVDRAAAGGASFTESDLETVRICHVLSRYQVEPRNLRLRSLSVEREAGLIEQVATASLRSSHLDKKEYGVKTVEDLGALFSRLNDLLLYRELRRLV